MTKVNMLLYIDHFPLYTLTSFIHKRDIQAISCLINSDLRDHSFYLNWLLFSDISSPSTGSSGAFLWFIEETSEQEKQNISKSWGQQQL